MNDFNKLLAEQLKDPEFQREWNIELVSEALKNFYYMKNKDIVFGRENSTEYNYSKGYLIGIITALNLEWTETDKQAIIINRNDETVFYTLDFKSEKGVII